MRRSRILLFTVVMAVGLSAGCSNEYGSGAGSGRADDDGPVEYDVQGVSGAGGASGSGSSCDPSYSGCVPMVDYDLDCPDVNGPLTVFGSDPHGFDRDGDGRACESG